MAPGLDVRPWPARPDEGGRFYVAAWNPPDGFFSRLGRPRAVFVLGAGIDRFLKRGDLPPADVPLVRLLDAGMARQMADYALAGVLRFQRNLDLYEEQQRQGLWRPQPARSADGLRVTVLGLGRIGSVVASTLAGLGYQVSGWNRGGALIPGVSCRSGMEALDALLAETDVLINVLPSTPATRGLLDRRRLSLLAPGAGLVNCGRGDQMDLDALVSLLDAGHLRGALLDVFPTEPLAADNPWWRHPKLRITPHVAAVTLPEPAARQVADGIACFEAGGTAAGTVDRGRGY
ncbi:MAG: glyoxylate/hydroxypyruvate reductase A [Telmatospirillum sp.]|nr:glyoxylate/hydroxypyruvate reductase A [Telmatospirillum sp.]